MNIKNKYVLHSQEIHNLEAKNNETEQRNEELKSQIVELENVLKASDNDKDSAIKRLRDELDAANNELNKRGYECLSLAEERSTLKNQLKEVAQKCQELALKLEKQRSMDSRSPFETEITQVCMINQSGPVVQSVVSLTNSLVVRMLTDLVGRISNSQVFLLEKCE